MTDRELQLELERDAAAVAATDDEMSAGPATSDRELKLLLASWDAPDAPESLQMRLINSYRQRVGGQQEEEEMKKCPKCQEEFTPQFKFCPIDGLPLTHGLYPQEVFDSISGSPTFESAFAAAAATESSARDGGRATTTRLFAFDADAAALVRASAEFRVTILEEAGLLQRLTDEVREVAHESELTWPEFRRDPVGFVKRTAQGYGAFLRRGLARENVGYGVLASFVVLLTLLGAIGAIDRYHKTHSSSIADRVLENIELTSMVEIPEEQKKPGEGAAGMSKGNGGGSKKNFEKPGGGGGGGRNEDRPENQGKLAQATLLPQVLAPDPKAFPIKNPALPTPTTLQADPKLFPPDPRPLPYGDPKSRAIDLSSGPGTGNGIGDGVGGGVGAGEGTGYGPGRGMNTGGGDTHLGGGGTGGPDLGGGYNRTFKTGEVTRKAVIISKPEPTYTEAARKNSVTGEVMLKVVLSASGQVMNISTVKGLPDGLTEKAIAAARQIQFQPAEKDGHKVSQYATIVYNFNIY